MSLSSFYGYRMMVVQVYVSKKVEKITELMHRRAWIKLI